MKVKNLFGFLDDETKISLHDLNYDEWVNGNWYEDAIMVRVDRDVRSIQWDVDGNRIIIDTK